MTHSGHERTVESQKAHASNRTLGVLVGCLEESEPRDSPMLGHLRASRLPVFVRDIALCGGPMPRPSVCSDLSEATSPRTRLLESFE